VCKEKRKVDGSQIKFYVNDDTNDGVLSKKMHASHRSTRVRNPNLI
jgi:hypothetical protein